MKFSVVCPIHNEEKYLPLTLPSIYRLKPSEVVFLLDSCTDNSARLVIQAASKYQDATNTKIHAYNKDNGQGWSTRLAYLFREGYAIADSPYILNTAGDLILDSAIAQNLHKLGYYRLITFGFYERNLQGVARLVYHAVKGTHYGGISLFDRQAYLDSEDLEDLRTSPMREDRHLIQAISSKYPTLHIPTLTLHLRPRAHNWARFIKLDREIT